MITGQPNMNVKGEKLTAIILLEKAVCYMPLQTIQDAIAKMNKDTNSILSSSLSKNRLHALTVLDFILHHHSSQTNFKLADINLEIHHI
jgi:hypothetical protein